jgi:hypothetical protein
MYSFLIAAALIVLALKIFKFRIHQSARPWTKLLQAAADAEGKGDLAEAERLLIEAEAYAASQKGTLWTQWRQMSRPRMAHLLFRRGQVDRAAVLNFEILQQSRTPT